MFLLCPIVHSCPTNVFETGTGDKALRTSGWETNLVRACDSLQKKKSNFMGLSRKVRRKIGQFHWIFAGIIIWGELRQKTVCKKWPVLWKFLGKFH